MEDQFNHEDLLSAREGGMHSDKSRWMRFEEWFWYDHHTLFEFHMNQYVKCCKDIN